MLEIFHVINDLDFYTSPDCLLQVNLNCISSPSPTVEDSSFNYNKAASIIIRWSMNNIASIFI